jgi:hypothetical protein
MKRFKNNLAIAVLSAVLGVACAAPTASAAPVWNLELHHGPTHFQPGESGELWFTVANVGNEGTFEPATLTINLPAGMSFLASNELGWTCPAAPGDTVITCTSTGLFGRYFYSLGYDQATQGYFGIDVTVDPSLAGQTALVQATLEGGGALAPVSDSEPIEVVTGPSPFGIVPGSFKGDFFREDGLTPVRQAGSHPPLLTVAFDFNNVPQALPSFPNAKLPTEAIRDLEVELPLGFVGNPSAVGECTPAQLISEACPRSSQVGRIDLGLEAISSISWLGVKSLAVYNMEHSRGSVTDLAFNAEQNIIRIKAELNPANKYAIKTVVPVINQFSPVLLQKLTVWGDPGSASHNFERCGNTISTEVECPSESSGRPFLTVPSQCGTEPEMSLRAYDSWESPGVFGPEIKYSMPGQTTGCELLKFEPDLTANATGQAASSPAGLEVNLKVPQNENINGFATPPVEKTTVTLPEGMTVSPSFASGLAGCSESQFGISHSGVPNSAAVACPDNSRIGSVGLATPLLPKPLEGSLYLANQNENPFNSTFAVYLAIHDTEERGVLLKIPGRLDLDPVTGRITTTFTDLPQLPFEEFNLGFRSGQRAPLINPPTCGPHTISAQITSYGQPNNPVNVSSTYNVTEGANGTTCPPNSAARSFSPDLSAGTLNPNAGSYSPFLFRLVRDDQEQEFSRISATLPPGMLANISGIPYCSDAAIASISGAEGTGRAQLAAPACPAASRIGSVSTGVGAGTEPNYFPGSVYLAGPYKGAPLSLAIVVPALAGPYDLGSVVVRTGISVDPTTAQVTAQSDPLPTIVHGVLLRIRDVRINVDRPNTTINPTSCNPLTVQANVLSLYGATANPSDRFQIGNCSRLAFSPKLALTFSGSTKRSGNPAIKAVLNAPKGQANIDRTAVILSKYQFIDNAHINNPCTRAQFAEEKCPPKSKLGFAKAYTPLLDKPLEGPVYFRSNGGERELPDLVAALRGQFDINLVGFIDSVKQKGSETSRVRTIFANVPDAPVTKFVLNLHGGKRGLIENSKNLCKVTNQVQVKMRGQNGKINNFTAPIGTSCKKDGKAKRVRPGGR